MTLAIVETSLPELADAIRVEQQRGEEGYAQAVDSAFAIGRHLLAARAELGGDREFGRWVDAQCFGLNRTQTWELQKLAEHEDEARVLLFANNSTLSLTRLARRLSAANGNGRDERPSSADVVTPPDADASATYPAIVIDPPWRYDNVATRGAAEDHYPTMSLDELGALELPAADDAHLYLWVTNGFLRQGFDLLDAWDFAYKTTLTWCKPQIGMGNYFRNNTEHVLFAVRGRLPVITEVKNVGTWFVADRTDHSAKPESFYDIVERCSPGPHLEMFARRRRLGWHTWGNEA